jgi:hypothetical protein
MDWKTAGDLLASLRSTLDYLQAQTRALEERIRELEASAPPVNTPPKGPASTEPQGSKVLFSWDPQGGAQVREIYTRLHPEKGAGGAAEIRFGPSGAVCQVHSPGYRAEIGSKTKGLGTFHPDPFREHLVYEWTQALTGHWPTHEHKIIIFQIHATPDKEEKGVTRHPPVSLGVWKGKYYIRVRSQEAQTGKSGKIEDEKYLDAPVIIGKDVDWRAEAFWNPRGKDGYFRLFQNGSRVYAYEGRTAYEDTLGPFAKTGIYVASWKTQRGKDWNREVIIRRMRILRSERR